MSDHLESAARAAQSILSARYPEQSWIVSVGKRHGDDGRGEVPAPGGDLDGTADKSARPIGGGDVCALPNRPDDDGVEKAA